MQTITEWELDLAIAHLLAARSPRCDRIRRGECGNLAVRWSVLMIAGRVIVDAACLEHAPAEPPPVRPLQRRQPLPPPTSGLRELAST